MEFENLHGTLRKLGVKGPRKTWKKRYFLQKQENINRLYYFVSEKSKDEQGFINLEEAISVLKTTDASFKKAHCFQINTPRRIYHLQADNEESMNYWIDGVSRILKRLNSAMEETDSQIGLQLEHANNRISDLEVEASRYRSALQLAATELGITSDEILRLVEQGESSLAGHVKPRTSPPVESKNETPKVVESPANNTEEKKSEGDTPVNEPPKSEDKPVEPEETVKEEAESSEDESEEDDTLAVDISGHFGAQVIYEYKARKNYELSISENEIITVMSKHENGWWLGCNHEGKQGYFPGSYVKRLEGT